MSLPSCCKLQLQEMPLNLFPKLLFHHISLVLSIFLLCTPNSAANLHDNFLRCFSLHSSAPSVISQVLYAPNNPSYQSILNFTAHNLRFTEPYTPRPQFIITPTHIRHVQAAIICSRLNGLRIRTRSGGHDYEGISFTSTDALFVLIDMINLRSIDIDVTNKVAWVQVGATLGQLYYSIAQKSRNLGFPAGISPNVGVGGHLSGGGYGILQRKYGLAADNIIDAQLVDVNGRVLDKKSMGDDLFWALRGGGGASFGVIIAFKVQLVDVPSIMTMCTATRTLNQNAINLMHDWQLIAPNLPNEAGSYLVLNRINTSVEANNSVQAAFQFQFLGRVDQLMVLLQDRYPQLRLARQECEEVSWIQSALIMAGLPSRAPLSSLLNRTLDTGPLRANMYFAKMKSDYVQKPIPKTAIQGMWERFYEPEGRIASVYFVAHGGRMSEISADATPYPHRAGNLFFAAYVVFWEERGIVEAQRHISWNRELYHFMKPYVSKSPRQAYMNYRDLDVGINNDFGNTSFVQASIWGFKYFKNNFYRLARIKANVDPTNFFRDQQSIPLPIL